MCGIAKVETSTSFLQEYARLSADLERLPSQREAKQAEQLLASEILGLERDIQFKAAELQGRLLDIHHHRPCSSR